MTNSKIYQIKEKVIYYTCIDHGYHKYGESIYEIFFTSFIGMFKVMDTLQLNRIEIESKCVE